MDNEGDAEQIMILEDLMHEIAQRLPQRCPWLMHSFEEDDDDVYSFICMQSGKTYQFPLPGISENRCSGSSQGWLFFQEANSKVSMLNPLIEVHLPLPSMSVFPTVRYFYLDEGVDMEAVYASSNLNGCIVDKMVLSANPAYSDDTIILGLVSHKIVFCRLGDPKWTLLCDWLVPYTDAIYHQGQFYVVDCMGTLFAMDLGSAQTTTLMIAPILLSEEAAIQRYLVEVGVDLLMICRIKHEGHDAELGQDCDRTVGFEIYKMDCSKELPEWTKLNSLGSYTVFIGMNSSVCFPSKDLPGNFKTDCVYFTPDFCLSNIEDDDVDPCQYNDIGIYSFADKRIEQLPCSPLCCSMYPIPMWLVPTL